MGYYVNPSVEFFIFCVQALRHCETYLGKKLIMNWYTGAKVKLGQTDDSNYQDEEAADPEVEVSYTQKDLEEHTFQLLVWLLVQVITFSSVFLNLCNRTSLYDMESVSSILFDLLQEKWP